MPVAGWRKGAGPPLTHPFYILAPYTADLAPDVPPVS